MKRESLEEILAKCAAKDGMSFCTIARSDAICVFVMSRSYNMSSSVSSVQKYVMNFYEQKKNGNYDKFSTKCKRRP